MNTIWNAFSSGSGTAENIRERDADGHERGFRREDPNNDPAAAAETSGADLSDFVLDVEDDGEVSIVVLKADRDGTGGEDDAYWSTRVPRELLEERLPRLCDFARLCGRQPDKTKFVKSAVDGGLKLSEIVLSDGLMRRVGGDQRRAGDASFTPSSEGVVFAIKLGLMRTDTAEELEELEAFKRHEFPFDDPTKAALGFVNSLIRIWTNFAGELEAIDAGEIDVVDLHNRHSCRFDERLLDWGLDCPPEKLKQAARASRMLARTSQEQELREVVLPRVISEIMHAASNGAAGFTLRLARYVNPEEEEEEEDDDDVVRDDDYGTYMPIAKIPDAHVFFADSNLLRVFPEPRAAEAALARILGEDDKKFGSVTTSGNGDWIQIQFE